MDKVKKKYLKKPTPEQAAKWRACLIDIGGIKGKGYGRYADRNNKKALYARGLIVMEYVGYGKWLLTDAGRAFIERYDEDGNDNGQ